MKLDGIGETLAQAIIKEREKNGLFFYIEDLLAVKGVGEKTLARFSMQLGLDEEK